MNEDHQGFSGITEIEGRALPKADVMDETVSWRGVLPVSGKYLIEIGGTRGNAKYTLEVAIR